MTDIFISGTSSGIGRSLAEVLLKDADNHIRGLSRRQKITHERYKHIAIDLSTTGELENFNFEFSTGSNRAILVNNAGWIGPIRPLSQQTPGEIATNFRINIEAPAILMQKFLEGLRLNGKTGMILNITSGAAKYPVSSWATYCASKSGLDMLTEVVAKENPDMPVLAVAPGIVDTPMQGQIRRTSPQAFEDHARFMSYFVNGELSPPEHIAAKLAALIRDPGMAPAVVFSLRELETP